jgi:hypothetical protein
MLSPLEYMLASQECAKAFPFVPFENMPDWMKELWLNDAFENLRNPLPPERVPCPVD